MRLINANDVIEHAEVNGESPEFVRKLIDYIDAHVIGPGKWVDAIGNPTQADYSVYCNRCGKWSEYRTEYCPHCGIPMEEKYER